MTWARIGCALAVLVGLVPGACKVDQDKEVALYRDVLDQGLQPRENLQQLADDERLGVVDVMTLANLRNETLAFEGENFLQALIEQRRAAARFLPTIALSPSYSWRDQPGGGGFGVTSAWNTSIETDMAISPVRDLANLRLTGASADEQRSLLLDFQDSLLIDVARTLYEAIRAERNVGVLEDSLRVQEERVSDARARREAGVMRPLDVSLSEAQAAQTATLLVEARVQALTARNQLTLLTAAAMHHRELVDDVALPPELPDFESLLAEAQQFREDLRAADRRMDAAGYLVESAYGQYFPSVSLNLQYFLQRQSAPTNLEWTSLVQISVPLFSAGLIEADVRTALSTLRQSKLMYSYTQRLVERDVRIALENLQASFQRIQRIDVQVKSAADALEQAEALYRAGLATNLERLTAQNALLNAELDLVNAELDSKVFYLDLRRVTGTLAELLGLQRGSVQTSRRNVETARRNVETSKKGEISASACVSPVDVSICRISIRFASRAARMQGAIDAVAG